MKRFLLFAGLFAGLVAKGQIYNNEWIDYNKTYYKFKVGETGLYRISQTALSTIGLGATPAENFQLWRNGQQVPIYTTVVSGPLGAGDYIEFWGERNDGKPDKDLYYNSDYQLNDKYSLETDTAAFFLTVNPAGGNLRLVNTTNNIAGNILPPEPYFMYTEGNYFRNYINGGNYVNAGEYVYSSSYDKGEGWVSADISSGNNLTNTHTVYPYLLGPDATFKINLVGNTIDLRTYKVEINNDSIYGDQTMNFLEYEKVTVPNIPVSLISSGSAEIKIVNTTPLPGNRMVIGQYELMYPRIFDFAGTSNFSFSLPANSSRNYIEISNFNNGSVAPVLYDLTNGKRYVGDISTPGLIKISLEPSAIDRKLLLVSEVASNVKAITSFTIRNFIDLTNISNQADYIIISHPVLFNGASGSNPVEDYRAYRNSVQGGSYNARIYQIDDLVDMFGFGIKKHPNSVRNFLRWARANFATLPKFVFLIGHGMIYDQYRYNEYNADVDRLNLIPTFGAPASDILLSADPGKQIPLTPIGRLSVITPDEVSTYLNKIKEYEDAQKFSSPSIADKSWMKNVVNVIGGNNPVLGTQLAQYMNKYKDIYSDSLYGASVTTFARSTPDIIEPLSDQLLGSLLKEGISHISYFGHSSSTVLDFNLDDPSKYDNHGKYPIFTAMGCNAGNFFNFNPARLYIKETLSESFVLAPERGSIAFIASSHYGIPHYIDQYNTELVKAEALTKYGKSIGEIMKEGITQVFNQVSQTNFYARFHTEQNALNGDPALKPNTQSKPDYVIEDPFVKLIPGFISIAETEFKVEAKFLNMGMVVNKNISIEIKRQYPDGNIVSVFKDTIPGIKYADSISVILPINPLTDKGPNKLIVSIDADNDVDELYESNNTVTKDFFIFEDDIKPVYPLDYAIINKQNIKLYASTANPFSPSKQYRMEIDTTELFNSPLKRSQTITSVGGLIEFDPGVSFVDGAVYYWRVSPLDNSGNSTNWHNVSFIYLANSELGFNQSHFYQHTKSGADRVFLDTLSQKWLFKPVNNTLFIRSGVYPTASGFQSDYTISINNNLTAGPGCNYNELIINVLDPVSFQPWVNTTGTLYNSSGICGTQREFNFHYFLSDTLWRHRAMNFLENIVPDGAYVVIRSNTAPYDAGNTYAPVWKSDTAYFGSGNSLYHVLKNQGFADVDLYDTTRCFAFIYKKNKQGEYTPQYQFSDGIYDHLLQYVICPTPDTLGYITSPIFGPAKEWKQMLWDGASVDIQQGDAPLIDIVGVTNSGTEDILYTDIDPSQQTVDISAIDPQQYPYLKLQMKNEDSVNLTPYQLKYWRLTYVPVPEGAIAPNVFIKAKDTMEAGEPFDFRVAFKNISENNFDSLKVKMTVTNANNIASDIPLSRFKPLISGDTLHIFYPGSTTGLSGSNTLFVDVNPDDDQPEQFHFNNFLYKNFFVKSDNTSPILDVTFDGVHILNSDIVSSKPHIVIKLKDESKWLILNDTAAAKLRVKYPNGIEREFYFSNTDTLRFTPPGAPPSPDNTASIDFLPAFLEDGTYELIVSGKDRSGNTAGSLDYKVSFQVINKPMISNMLNYPNPFTTSTAFVFTITGSEVPQNIKIEIMTVTGKIVREITKDELGSLHIGRNITEFKWDGTDQFGQKLANGVYLYRVVTNLNGKSLDKYKSTEDNTDKYFNKGYGKMYLMR